MMDLKCNHKFPVKTVLLAGWISSLVLMASFCYAGELIPFQGEQQRNYYSVNNSAYFSEFRTKLSQLSCSELIDLDNRLQASRAAARNSQEYSYYGELSRMTADFHYAKCRGK